MFTRAEGAFDFSAVEVFSVWAYSGVRFSFSRYFILYAGLGGLD